MNEWKKFSLSHWVVEFLLEYRWTAMQYARFPLIFETEHKEKHTQVVRKDKYKELLKKGVLSNVSKKIKETEIAYIRFFFSQRPTPDPNTTINVSYVTCYVTLKYAIMFTVCHVVMSRYNIQGQGFFTQVYTLDFSSFHKQRLVIEPTSVTRSRKLIEFDENILRSQKRTFRHVCFHLYPIDNICCAHGIKQNHTIQIDNICEAMETQINS